MTQAGNNQGQGEPEIPAGLARELRAVYRGGARASRGMDEAVLGLARERAAAAGGGRRLRVAGWLSAAAAVVLVASLLYVRPWAGGVTGGGVVAAGAMDVNGDGVVDILDALALAKAVEAGTGTVDVNGDGVVDGVDVGVLAAAAVRLDGKRS